MKVSISIFLGLALIAGAIYYKPSFACSTDEKCAVLNSGKVTFLHSGAYTIYQHDVDARTYRYVQTKQLPDVYVK